MQCRVRSGKMRTNEQGFILVTILLVIALLFPLILAFNARVQLNLVQAANFRNSIQALRIARSGVEGAIAILKEDDPSYDAKTDKWALAFPSLAIGDGILSVSVTDEDGKLPINNLVTAVKSTQAGARCRGRPGRAVNRLGRRNRRRTPAQMPPAAQVRRSAGSAKCRNRLKCDERRLKCRNRLKCLKQYNQHGTGRRRRDPAGGGQGP